jgi:hypothetical protein
LIFTDHLGFARNIPDGMVLMDKLCVALLDVVHFWNVFRIFEDLDLLGWFIDLSGCVVDLDIFC